MSEEERTLYIRYQEAAVAKSHVAPYTPAWLKAQYEVYRLSALIAKARRKR